MERHKGLSLRLYGIVPVSISMHLFQNCRYFLKQPWVTPGGVQQNICLGDFFESSVSLEVKGVCSTCKNEITENNTPVSTTVLICHGEGPLHCRPVAVSPSMATTNEPPTATSLSTSLAAQRAADQPSASSVPPAVDSPPTWLEVRVRLGIASLGTPKEPLRCKAESCAESIRDVPISEIKVKPSFARPGPACHKFAIFDSFSLRRAQLVLLLILCCYHTSLSFSTLLVGPF